MHIQWRENSRTRNILYKSYCKLCNKEATEMESKRKESTRRQGVHVGESSRSLHERAKEHWAAYAAKAEDSYILKHWVNHHGGQGEPHFRIDVIKY